MEDWEALEDARPAGHQSGARRRMIKRTSLIAAKIGLVLAAVFLVALGAAWARLAAGPLELPALTRQIEANMSRARDGRPVDIASVELFWAGAPRGLQLQARDVRILDADGSVISQYAHANIGLGVLPLFIGRIAIVSAEFEGGDIAITRKPDRSTEIAFGPLGSAPDIVIPGVEDDAPLAVKVNRALDGLARAFRPVGAGGALRSLVMRDAQVEMIDEGNGARWTANHAVVALERSGRRLGLVVDARVEGPEGGAPITLRISTDTGFRAAEIQFATRQARPRALFSPAMLGVFAGLDAPVTAEIVVGLDRRVGINRFEGDVVVGRGGAVMNGGDRFALEGGRVHGRYDLERDVLTIDQLALNGSRTRIQGEAHLANASALFSAEPDQPANFDISLPAATLDVPGVFEAPFDLQRVRLSGAVEGGAIRFTRIDASRDQARLTGTGRLTFARAGPQRRVYPGIALDGRITGTLDVRSVIALWPIPFVEGARSYLKESLTAGQVTEAIVKLNIPPAELAARQLTDPSLDIRFNYTGASMRYITTMSPLTAARGSAILRGNRFDLTVDDGRLDGLVTTGTVEIPRLNPRGAMMTITARGQGDARALVGLLMQEPIALGPRFPVEPSTVGGRGTATLVYQRPNQADATVEQSRFTVDGTFQNVSGTMRENGLRLAEGNLRVRGDQRAVTVYGPMELGSSNVNVSWTERIGAPSATSSRYQISGVFEAEDLEMLGYPARAISQGRIGVAVTGEGQGFAVNEARVELDLTRARAFLPRAFWTKAPGQSATVSFDVAAADGDYLLSNIVARGSGLSANGSARLYRDGRLRSADITRFAIDGRADLAIAASRGADGALDIAARGPLLDAAPFLDAEPEPAPAPPAARPGQAAPTPRPIRIAVRTDRMELRGGVAMTNASANLVLSPEFALQTLTTQGQVGQGRSLALGLGPRAADPQGRIAFRSDDAGFAWRGFTGADNIVGGTVTADGTWRMGPPSVAQFNLHMRDFRVVRVPAMAHLLGSVASLTGFVEMLNGDGISFSSLDAPVTMNADEVAFAQARMAGPTLGLTANGNYNMGANDLDVDGVVVPSYGLNSVLGNVPILGNLLTSRRGEGIFGMTYAVNGPVEAPRVGVNPLSALTPGILRRIFEPLGPRRPTEQPATAAQGG